MSRPERQQNVLDLLKGLRGIEPLKQLFWSELNYQRVNQPLSRRGWTESASKALADDPVLFAGGGEDNDFHVIYARLASDKLLLGGERLVVSRLLNEHPYTLFVFSNTAQDHWHFLNVKYDEASDKRRLFRRITVGPEERLRTASERISLLSLESFGLAPLTIQQHHDEAFDVEMVTTLFYKNFAELFHELRSDIINSKPGLENEGRNATQDLMNRLLFLYFIQKKGWLDSNPFYLVERFGQTARKTPKATNYYSETLLPLFLALSAPDAPSAKLGKVPFLNGGLFELDLPTEAQLKISNAIFGRLFDELFEHYNFTVREDTPLDQEVAVDPEMLGKVFEETVLEQEQGKDARRGSGSYYTRRVVTHFKARDALRLYLLDESFWPAGTWDKKDLPIDLSGADSKHGSLESLAHRAARHTTRDRVDKYLRTRDPSHLDIPLARHLRDLLKKVKVCDLACGSGAYLVEMLHAIADLWRQLSDILNEKCLPEDKLRQQIISENLYGADIQKTAVKICELRLWLALVVDKELPPGEMPPPLPNLSYRIRVGDSLRSEFAGIIFSPHSLVLNDKTRKRVEQLNERRLQYFSINNEKRKHDLSTEVDKLELELFEAEIDDQIKRLKTFAALNPDDEEKIRQLQTARKDLRDPKKPKPFVWHIHFSEVFSDGRTGFDIMLANPPYGLKEENHPPADFGLQSKDSYGLFVVRALDLLREGGIFSFIMSDTWQTIKSHKPLRRRLLDSACVRHLLMMPAWIFGATVNTSILVLRKRADTSSAAARERRESVIVAADLTRVPKDELLLQVGFDSMHEPQSQRPCDEEMAFYEYPQELILTNSNLPFFVT